MATILQNLSSRSEDGSFWSDTEVAKNVVALAFVGEPRDTSIYSNQSSLTWTASQAGIDTVSDLLRCFPASMQY